MSGVGEISHDFTDILNIARHEGQLKSHVLSFEYKYAKLTSELTALQKDTDEKDNEIRQLQEQLMIAERSFDDIRSRGDQLERDLAQVLPIAASAESNADVIHKANVAKQQGYASESANIVKQQQAYSTLNTLAIAALRSRNAQALATKADLEQQCAISVGNDVNDEHRALSSRLQRLEAVLERTRTLQPSSALRKRSTPLAASALPPPALVATRMLRYRALGQHCPIISAMQQTALAFTQTLRARVFTLVLPTLYAAILRSAVIGPRSLARKVFCPPCALRKLTATLSLHRAARHHVSTEPLCVPIRLECTHSSYNPIADAIGGMAESAGAAPESATAVSTNNGNSSPAVSPVASPVTRASTAPEQASAMHRSVSPSQTHTRTANNNDSTGTAASPREQSRVAVEAVARTPRSTRSHVRRATDSEVEVTADEGVTPQSRRRAKRAKRSSP